MKTKTEKILDVLNVLTWIVFIGLLIQTGAILISYGISLFNPEAAGNLYTGMDLSSLRESGILKYTCAVSLKIAILCLKAYSAYLVIKILTKINMSNPFNSEIAGLIEKVSYVILDILIITIIANEYSNWLSDNDLVLRGTREAGEFLFLAGVIFVFAQIFKKGVELQSENELTI